jgi:hypothetical protein
MNTPILDNVETNMASLIVGMSINDGYNFDWKMVNQEDETLDDYPQAVINPTDSLADKETSQDTTAGLGSQDYTNEVLFTVLVKGELKNPGSNPIFEVRSILRKCLDDLKKLFGTNYTLNNSCDNILYVGSQQEPKRNNDVQRPAQLRTIWKIIYAQDRQNPSQYASS